MEVSPPKRILSQVLCQVEAAAPDQPSGVGSGERPVQLARPQLRGVRAAAGVHAAVRADAEGSTLDRTRLPWAALGRRLLLQPNFEQRHGAQARGATGFDFLGLHFKQRIRYLDIKRFKGSRAQQ